MVKLRNNTEAFPCLNAKPMFVMREESVGVNGFENIKAKCSTKCILALGSQKKVSASRSPSPMTFGNDVISSDGIIWEVVLGSQRKRADVDVLIDVINVRPSVDR